MDSADDRLQAASQSWKNWCAALERTGLAALRDTMTDDEIDLAEGLRHLTRMVRIVTMGCIEDNDTLQPTFRQVLGPYEKQGGDNPQGLYLSAPINGTDTFLIAGKGGTADWISLLTRRSSAGRASGLPPFGNALFSANLQREEDGSFEVLVSPEPQMGNWIASDEFVDALLVRQFFGSPENVQPMELTIRNLSAPGTRPEPYSLAQAIAALDDSADRFQFMVPRFQHEMIDMGASRNRFDTEVDLPSSKSGGVPGGNAVIARWSLEPDEALVIRVRPPDDCPYWDLQVGNGWYESFDYRHHFSGLGCTQAHYNADGSVTVVLSQEDPGVRNWVEAAGHREGHVAIRWQLSDDLPLPECQVIAVRDARSATGLPPVTPEDRDREREALRASFYSRFGK